MVLPVNLLTSLAMFAAVPRNMPPLSDYIDPKAHITSHIRASTSDYGARKNHPTAYDDNPPFKGPLRLEQTASPDAHRVRIRHWCAEKRQDSLQTDDVPTMGPSTPTETILKSIVDHLARKDAPVDAKEVAESFEFYLRCGKRLIGAARRVLQNNQQRGQATVGKQTIAIHDLCSGHGLTGLLFLACNPPGRIRDTTVRAVLVDQFEPKAHSILRGCISEICPWVSEDTVSFQSSTLEEYASRTDNDGKKCTDVASVVISTHACGSLTDKVLQFAAEAHASSLAVMPCCYTGTDSGVPYGVRRMLGVGLSADIGRSFYLQDHGYHTDFAAIPRAVTAQNRIIVAERRR